MKQKIIDFLKNETGADEKCNINYRPYIYGSLVESINFMAMVDEIYNDFIEICDISNGCDKEKIINSVLKMYRRHIVVF